MGHSLESPSPARQRSAESSQCPAVCHRLPGRPCRACTASPDGPHGARAREGRAQQVDVARSREPRVCRRNRRHGYASVMRARICVRVPCLLLRLAPRLLTEPRHVNLVPEHVHTLHCSLLLQASTRCCRRCVIGEGCCQAAKLHGAWALPGSSATVRHMLLVLSATMSPHTPVRISH